MPSFRNVRRCLPLVIGFAAILLVTSSAALASDPYGELSRFGKGLSLKPEEEINAFGVDAAEGNDVYVGEESKLEEYRIRKFSPTGTELGDTAGVKLPEAEYPEGPSGLEGVAIDSKEHRIYVLVVYTRAITSTIDAGTRAAGTLYAFKTEANGKKELEPATGTKPGGVVATPAMLNSKSESAGTTADALLTPSGIAVDPSTHEVLILGTDDRRAGGETLPKLYTAIQRVKAGGELGARYVDPEPFKEQEQVNSPVVSQTGKVFFQRQATGGVQAQEVVQVPSSFVSVAPQAVYRTGSIEGENLFEFNPNVEDPKFGAALSFVPEGEHGGRLYTSAEVHMNSEVAGKLEEGGSNPGVVGLAYSESGETGSASDLGWTGGQEHKVPCAIGQNETRALYPMVAAGSGGSVFVLDASTKEVIQFGPNGEGCAKASAKITAEAEKVVVKEGQSVPTGTTLTLSSEVIQGNALGVTWEFGDGTPNATGTFAFQETEVKHKFEGGSPGGLEPTVTERIHTDDLASPEIVATRKLLLTAAKPVVTHNPEDTSVLEGASAKFTATASGVGVTVQWQVSTNKGSTWANDTVDVGTTTNTLTVESPKGSLSGNEYRAVFKNLGGEAASSAATLTVETLAQHKEKVEKEEAEKRAKEHQEAKERQEAQERQEAKERQEAAEAAAAKKAAEEGLAAKKAAEEAAKNGVEPFHEGSPIAKVASSSVTVSRSGQFSLKVSCQTGATSCTGTITLRTLRAVSASGKRAILTLTSASFTIAGGQQKTLTLRLSGKARALLTRSKNLPAKVSILAHNVHGETATTLSTLTLHAHR